MPKFSVAFNRRKSTATSEDFQHGSVTPEHSSFRVIERTDPALGKSFDGGARMARAAGNHIPKPTHLELDSEDNMFADLKSGNRGSGASNTTKATSTDTSSRHSNASTAPSSTNLEGQDDPKHFQKKNLHDIAPRPAVKSSGSGFLNRAGRTFSFGVQKKHNASSPKIGNDEIPPVPAIQQDTYSGRSRGLTESTTSTATPPKLEMENGNMDMGGDFGSMFSSFDKRASVVTMRADGSAAPRSLTNNRPIQPPPLSINKVAKVEPGPESWNSRNEDDNLLGSQPGSPELDDVPPPVPRHQSSFKTTSRPSDIIEDEDARLLQDSIAVGRLLSESSSPNPPSGRYRRNEDSFSSFERRPLNTSFNKGDDNLFEGTSAQTSRITNRFNQRAPSPPRNNKVMTPAEFEKYRKDKERHESSEVQHSTTNNNDDEDEINYDDDEDDVEKSKQQAKQRRKQEAHMAVYRQQMMKVTGEQPDMHTPDRPGLASSMSAPQLHLMKTPSPGPPVGGSDEDDDEEVPLAILQAHGFPNKNRPPARLSTMGSNPNLRASTQLQPQRPGSAMGENSQNQRHSMLPAFARGLPQDPFVGASISKPAMRESLTFSGGLPASESQQSLPPGGLVGVIASEERSRAMRRGGPNANGQKFVPGLNGPQGPPFDNMPPGMMNGMGGMYNMPAMGMSQPQMMQPPQLTVGDQAQLQMTQQMSQFMQMQMQFMQMMATNNQQQSQPGGMMPPMQNPYGGLSATQSMNDLSSRHSMMIPEPSTLEPPRRMDAGMRTMSMVQPSSGASFMQPPGGYAGSIHGLPMGYTPSIAPSERSNIGLPGRYRPVSQMPAPAIPDPHRRTSTMSGALGRWDEPKGKSTINVVSASGDGSDDDDEEGWEAMKAKRDKKRSMWKSKKGLGSDFTNMI
ncbi:hypothetical protein NW762_000892 [Fusarium torreyae]|uniref:Uncharacterized protein n=1 Tax=Fusarium torreyae TaxID=1237075 RepID=A0A9W8VNH5_9HYPO|nr:hypothetical protein NW762_000892 [Fusarium torreyae]